MYLGASARDMINYPLQNKDITYFSDGSGKSDSDVMAKLSQEFTSVRRKTKYPCFH